MEDVPLVLRAYGVRGDGTRVLVWVRTITEVVPAPVVALPPTGVDVYRAITAGPGPFPFSLQGGDDDQDVPDGQGWKYLLK